VGVGRGSCELAFQLEAKFFQRGVKNEADVADSEAGDFSDLLVGAVVLELEFEDFLLVGSEGFDEFPDAVGEVLDIGLMAGFFVLGGKEGEGGVVAEVEAVVFAEDVEGAIATDGVKPGFEVFADLGVVSDPEFEEGVLDDVTGSLGIPIEDAGGVTDERAFMFLERTLDQLMGFAGVALVWHAVNLPD
jgi:hypothetical protein